MFTVIAANKNKMKSPYYTPCLGQWFLYYKERTGETYDFSPKDGAHLKQLIKKVERKLTERSMEVNEANVVNSFSAFLYAISDKWILEHLEIAIINSKWNSLYVAASKASPLGRSESIDEVIRRRRSEGV